MATTTYCLSALLLKHNHQLLVDSLSRCFSYLRILHFLLFLLITNSEMLCRFIMVLMRWKATKLISDRSEIGLPLHLLEVIRVWFVGDEIPKQQDAWWTQLPETGGHYMLAMLQCDASLKTRAWSFFRMTIWELHRITPYSDTVNYHRAGYNIDWGCYLLCSFFIVSLLFRTAQNVVIRFSNGDHSHLFLPSILLETLPSVLVYLWQEHQRAKFF